VLRLEQRFVVMQSTEDRIEFWILLGEVSKMVSVTSREISFPRRNRAPLRMRFMLS
jgi:hypothetical protein